MTYFPQNYMLTKCLSQGCGAGAGAVFLI